MEAPLHHHLVHALVLLSLGAPLVGCDLPVSWQWQQATSGTATLTGAGGDQQLSFSGITGATAGRPFDLSAQQTLAVEVGPGTCAGRLELALAYPISGPGTVRVTGCALDLVCGGQTVVAPPAACACTGALLVDRYVSDADAPDPTALATEVPVESLAARLELRLSCPDAEYELLDASLAVELVKRHVEPSHDHHDDDWDD
jgi:hypothetical protein